MQEVINRMRVEYDQLDERLNKLIVFLGSSKFKSLSVDDCNMLTAQAGAMEAYRYILGRRLSKMIAECGNDQSMYHFD